MEIKPIEVFSEASNYAIVRMPGRHFPGCVIQGDSLSNLQRTAKLIAARLSDSADEDLRDCAMELAEALESRLTHYENVLKAHQIELPYLKLP